MQQHPYILEGAIGQKISLIINKEKYYKKLILCILNTITYNELLKRA